MMFFKKLTPVFLVFLVTYYTPNAADAQYFTGSAAGALGDSGVAANDSGEETFLNPASIAHAPSFTIATFYRDGYSNVREHQTSLAINLVDNNKEALFPGSFGYVQNRRSFDGALTVDDDYFQISVGNFVHKQLAFGVSLLHLASDQVGGSKFEQWNGVAGFHWNPLPDLGLGLVYYNFAEVDEDVPTYLQLLPKASLGMTYILNEFFRVRFDVSRQLKENPDDEFEVAGGTETIMNNFMILRLGFRSGGAQKRDYLTAGFGFLGPKFQVHYALRKLTKGLGGALHSVDLLIPF